MGKGICDDRARHLISVSKQDLLFFFNLLLRALRLVVCYGKRFHDGLAKGRNHEWPAGELSRLVLLEVDYR